MTKARNKIFCSSERCKNPSGNPTTLKGIKSRAIGICSYCADGGVPPGGPSDESPTTTGARHPSVVEIERRPRLSLEEIEKLVLRAGFDLGVAQLGHEREKDFIGLSNADYQLGMLLSQCGESVPLASLLTRYTGQTEPGYGLSALDLRRFLTERAPKEFNPSYERTSSKSIEDRARASVRGKIGVVEDPALAAGEVRMACVSVPRLAAKIFAAEGRKDKHGYIVPANRLAYYRATLGDAAFVDVSRIDEITSRVAQDMTPSRAIVVEVKRAELADKTGLNIAIRATINSSTPVQYLVDWNAPFSPNGEKVRGIVKSVGGKWGGGGWIMSRQVAVSLRDALSTLEFCDPSALPDASVLSDAELAEAAELVLEQETGVLNVKHRVNQDGQTVQLWVRRRNSASDALWSGVKSIGGRWNREDKMMEISIASLPRLFEALDSHAGLSLSGLLDAVNSINDGRIDRLVTEKNRLREMANRVPKITPSGITLYGHQTEGIAFLLGAGAMAVAGGDREGESAHGAILADDMGLGKTLQSIVAAGIKYPDRGQVKLIVCPASIKTNWRREIVKWIGSDVATRIHVIKGKKGAIPADAEWVIVNYDVLKDHREALRELAPAIIIVDEAQELRNPGTQRADAFFGTFERPSGDDMASGDAARMYGKFKGGVMENAKEVWPMTGTPVVNRPGDLLNILRAIRHPMARDARRFIDRYQNNWTKEAQNLDELGDKIGRSYLRRTKDQVLDLPEKQLVPVTHEMTSEQRRRYQATLDDLIRRSPHVVEIVSKMKHLTAQAKAPHTIQRIEEILAEAPDRKIVVFSHYHDVLDSIEGKFGTLSVRLDGTKSDGQKTSAIDRFNADPAVRLFIAQTEAGGVGHNLTAAQDSVFNDFPFTPAKLSQAEDRIYRIGQTKRVQIHHMILADSFDERLLELLEQKRAVIAAIEGRATEKAARANAESIMDQMLTYLVEQTSPAARRAADGAARERSEKAKRAAEMKKKAAGGQ